MTLETCSDWGKKEYHVIFNYFGYIAFYNCLGDPWGNCDLFMTKIVSEVQVELKLLISNINDTVI